MSQQWTDRRPIAYDELGAKEYISPTNRNGWNPNQAPCDFSQPNAVTTWQTAQLARAAANVLVMKSYNAQTYILWDAEGYGAHDLAGDSFAYDGDPPLVKMLAPELASILPRKFGIYHAAGIRTGMTLRAQDWIVKGNTIVDGSPSTDLFKTLYPRIKYAQQAYGCSVFYVDCAAWGETTAYQRLLAHFPGILLIPERLSPAGYQWASSYGDGGQGMLGTLPSARTLFPTCFSVLKANMTIPQLTPAAIKANGDVCLLPAWYASEEVAAQIALGN